jgi:hydrogenase-4 membrane subunit HyfE
MTPPLTPTLQMLEQLLQIQNLLEIGLLLTALFITIDRSIARIIGIYQFQSLLIAIVTGLSVVTFGSNIAPTGGIIAPAGGIIVLIVFLPLTMIVVVRPLLARATILFPSDRVLMAWLLRPIRSLRALQRISGIASAAEDLQRDAEQEWILPRELNRVHVRHLIVLLLIVLVALLIAADLFSQRSSSQNSSPFEQSKLIGLLASLVLGLVGLYNMVIKQDTISQVVGLLMMDHGLYLAVMKIVPIPFPATFFVIGLYFYTITTMFILVIILPGVRDIAGDIELTKVREQSDLIG